MKKRAVFTAGVLIFTGLLFWFLRPVTKEPADPFAIFDKPFVCTVQGEIEDFDFSFDVQNHQNCLQLTITAPKSLAGVRARLEDSRFSLYKDDLQVQTSGSLQGLITSLFQNTGAKIVAKKDCIVAKGTDQNGDFEIKFDRDSLFPISIIYKNAKITATIENFAPAAD